jgi:hypothetical protein
MGVPLDGVLPKTTAFFTSFLPPPTKQSAELARRESPSRICSDATLFVYNVRTTGGVISLAFPPGCRLQTLTLDTLSCFVLHSRKDFYKKAIQRASKTASPPQHRKLLSSLWEGLGVRSQHFRASVQPCIKPTCAHKKTLRKGCSFKHQL